MLDAELLERPADLGKTVRVDLAAGDRGLEVVAAAVGIERAEQAVLADDLAQRREAAHGAFLLDEEHRVDRAVGVIHGHDQVELRVEAGKPAVPRAVLMQHHPDQGAPRPLLAMGAFACRQRRQPAAMQEALGPGVAERKSVVLHQMLPEVLGVEAGIALPVKLLEPIRPVLRHPLR